MRRSLVVLLLVLCVPAVALAAYSKGTWTGIGKVPGAPQKKDRTVKLRATVQKGECLKHVGLDEVGNPKTEEVDGTCLSFRGRASYQARCTFASGAPATEETVPLPNRFLIGSSGVLSVTLKTQSDNRQATQRKTNALKIRLSGKRASGTATYLNRAKSLGGDVTCRGRMTISLKHG